MSDDTMDIKANDGPLPEGRFSGRIEFQQLIRDALATAARDGWREIILSDANFNDWPLGERSVVESLQAWADNGRKITLLARRYDDVLRFHARFVNWRTKWSHIVEARGCRIADVSELPSAIWSPTWVMQRLDSQWCHGVCGTEPERRQALRETLQEWLRKSSEAFPASTLGL
ncbi:MAG TPA: hypothetical protein VLJ86_14960 [Ramlibacter sp.]|nr:hypothetical protein [Ramlibacter sp.]